MHDYFDILGLPVDAPASEVRRACARRGHRGHPDFRARSNGAFALPATGWLSSAPMARDVAIDFVDAATFVEEMQAAFFSSER